MDPLSLSALVAGFVSLGGGGLLLRRSISNRSEASATREAAERSRQETSVLEERLQRERQELARESETLRREVLLAARDEAHIIRQAAEQEARELRAQVQRLEEHLVQREGALERRLASLEQRESEVKAREQEVRQQRDKAQALVARNRIELERMAGLTHEEARSELLRSLEDELRMESARLIKQLDDETREEATRRARQILVMAMQRCAVDQVSESTVSVVPLPTDEMKGRIIGREGRNIRAFETLTGVDLIIDDTPEAVVLSAFDPIRRETARVALGNLITDGRIHPGKIEETITRAREEIDARIRDAGEAAVLKSGVAGLHPELVRILGKLHYRTSYGQNALDHSVEVAHLAGILAAELGVDAATARRAGLLHDVGKALDHEFEGSHLDLSVEMARKYGENESVIHAVEAHHGDVEFRSVEAVIVQIADAMSSSRPGARREMLESYLKRMQRLEKVADSLPGVEKSFAVQAGRELRIIVKPDAVDDIESARLARDTARRIEQELEYPGQIKVTVIRETRSSDYAR